MSGRRTIVPIGDTAKKFGRTTASGKGSGVVVTNGTQSGSSAPRKPSGGTSPAKQASGGASAQPYDTDTAAGRGALRRRYAEDGDPLVAARDYTTGGGYSGAVRWDGESVTIGGVPIEPEYVIDGTAYVPRSEADTAIDEMEERNGIIGAEGVRDMWDERYGGLRDDVLYDVIGREAFSYDPEDDPVYDAYRRMYRREADDALMRVLNENNTSITGASGAVLSEALADRDLYLDRMTDMIPELAADAYSRYEGETERLLDTLDAASEIGGEYYDRLYQSDRDAYSDLIEAGEREREERQRIAENNRNAQNDSYDNALAQQELERGEMDLRYYGDMAEQELRRAVLENDISEHEYYQSLIESAMDSAERRGFFIPGDEAALPWLAAYRSGSGYSLSPYAAAAQRELMLQHARQGMMGS